MVRTSWPIIVPLVVVLVGTWTYRWVDEDAFINFRIIHNLLAGHGPVFNVGERVEVDSDPLWVVTLTLAHLVLPMVSLAWTSVVLGLICTAGAFGVAGRAAVRMYEQRVEGTALPVGLTMVSAVAGVWEFATSGLEMSMVFLWLAASFLLLVRVERTRIRAVPAAVVAGLGVLVRPELALGSAVFLAALVSLVAAPSWRGRGTRGRRILATVAAATVIPVATEIARMAYYALVIPTTGLAKAAASTWWSQGLRYLWNFVGPYWLWLPLAACAVLVVSPAIRWWGQGDRAGVLLLATPIVAGGADLLYVVAIGGDYMHARLLLPAFFAVSLPIVVTTRQLRGVTAAMVAVVAVWAVVCAGWLRYVPSPTLPGNMTAYISNERNNWITATGVAHPITTGDYRRALSGRDGAVLRSLAASAQAGHQELLVITDPYAPIDSADIRPARSPLPFTLVVNLPAIGVIGDLVGPDVYVFDSYSLANPIGSHTTVAVHTRPGHEKYLGPAWMIARFGVPGSPPAPGGPSSTQIAAAHRALGCQPLAGYLRAITAPMTPGRAWSDIVHSFSYTGFSFSPVPQIAARQLCGPVVGGR
ncbi:MAG: hypothetical protein M0013_06875 [Actinomycetota bacterium]|nr:hypothetical protein [Actinomycetota bacterium]